MTKSYQREKSIRFTGETIVNYYTCLSENGKSEHFAFMKDATMSRYYEP